MPEAYGPRSRREIFPVIVKQQEDLDWMRDGSCRGRRDSFVLPEGIRAEAKKRFIENAKTICQRRCPVLPECDAFAKLFDDWYETIIAGRYYGGK